MSPSAVFVSIYRYSNFRTFHYEEVRFEICLFQRLAVGFGFILMSVMSINLNLANGSIIL